LIDPHPCVREQSALVQIVLVEECVLSAEAPVTAAETEAAFAKGAANLPGQVFHRRLACTGKAAERGLAQGAETVRTSLMVLEHGLDLCRR